MERRIVGSVLMSLAMLAAGGSTVESQSYAPFRGFEIQSYPANRGPWFEAAYYCAIKEGARLCRASEWAVACRSGRFKPGGSPEWVDEVAPDDGSASPAQRLPSTRDSGREGLRAMAFVDCERGVWLSPRETLPMRCCRTRTEAPSAR
jgi:hypothetical protein